MDEGSFGTIEGCTTITGSVYIHATSDIDDIVLPPTLQHLTGSCVCTGGEGTYPVDAISAQGLISVATDQADQAAKQVGLVVAYYDTLKSLSFPNLTTVGSHLVLAGNPQVANVSGFDSLNAVSGNVDITGNFASLSLPSLASVNGSFNVQSTSPNFTCPDFSHVAIKGSFVCTGNVSNPQPLTVDNSTTSPSSLPNITTPSVTSSATASSTSTSVAPAASSASSSASTLVVRCSSIRFKNGITDLRRCFHDFLPIRTLVDFVIIVQQACVDFMYRKVKLQCFDF